VTNRQYIKRRVRVALAIAIGFWLLISFVAHAAGSLAPILGVLGTAAFFGAYLSILLIRCQECRARISTSIAIPVAFHLFGSEIKVCPYCSQSLDDPIENPANQQRVQSKTPSARDP